ncbi:MAG: hypothetical protein AAFN70_06905, partial [Planctomycetota bacterium]
MVAHNKTTDLANIVTNDDGTGARLPKHGAWICLPVFALAALLCGCRTSPQQAYYNQKMGQEIRLLEDQLYEADYENQRLFDEVQRWKRKYAEKHSDALPDSTATPLINLAPMQDMNSWSSPPLNDPIITPAPVTTSPSNSATPNATGAASNRTPTTPTEEKSPNVLPGGSGGETNGSNGSQPPSPATTADDARPPLPVDPSPGDSLDFDPSMIDEGSAVPDVTAPSGNAAPNINSESIPIPSPNGSGGADAFSPPPLIDPTGTPTARQSPPPWIDQPFAVLDAATPAPPLLDPGRSSVLPGASAPPAGRYGEKEPPPGRVALPPPVVFDADGLPLRDPPPQSAFSTSARMPATPGSDTTQRLTGNAIAQNVIARSSRRAPNQAGNAIVSQEARDPDARDPDARNLESTLPTPPYEALAPKNREPASPDDLGDAGPLSSPTVASDVATSTPTSIKILPQQCIVQLSDPTSDNSLLLVVAAVDDQGKIVDLNQFDIRAQMVIEVFDGKPS